MQTYRTLPLGCYYLLSVTNERLTLKGSARQRHFVTSARRYAVSKCFGLKPICG